MNGSVRKPIQTLADRLMSRLGLSRQRQFYVDHILSIACTGHGASLAYMNSQGVLRSSVLDRWVGIKDTLMFSEREDRGIRHADSGLGKEIRDLLVYGFGKFPETKIFEDTVLSWTTWLLHDLDVSTADIELIVTSNSHFATGWAGLGSQLRRWFPKARVVKTIEHHEIHQRQAFWQSGFPEAVILTLDTCGEVLSRIGNRKLAGTIAVMNHQGEYKRLSEFFFPESSAGLIYSTVTHHVGFRQGEEGKTMGLAPYGEPELFENLQDALHLYEDGSFRFLDNSKFCRILHEYTPPRQPGQPISPQHRNVAYAGQALLDLIVANAWQAALALSGMENLAYAGGVALNSVSNQKAYQQAAPKRLYVATNPGDTGHALGCVLYGAYELAKWSPPRHELHEYLGPTYSRQEITTAVNRIDLPVACPDQLETTIARCIANGHIVARFAGQAEFGPRALGNRSILCDPRRLDMKDYLNAKVKHREAFRPFAPSVLEEHARDWFDFDDRNACAYMLRVVMVRAEKRDQIPAVLHMDHTARIQSLTYEENPGYWRLIEAFYHLTGIPLVLNTSFNLAGRPIVETPQDAIECFRETEIDVLVLDSYVISKLPLDAYLINDRVVA